MEASHHLILLGSALVLLSIFAGVFSARFGAPLLLVSRPGHRRGVIGASRHLHLRRLELRPRIAAVLEIESGINDPISVLLTVLLIEVLVAPTPLPISHIVVLLAREIVGGAAFGIGGGYLLLALVNRLETTSGL